AAASTASASETSASTIKALPPSFSTSYLAPSRPSFPRAINPMRAPSFVANSRAIARPKPADAPVMTTTLSALLVFIEQSHIIATAVERLCRVFQVGRGGDEPADQSNLSDHC